MVTSKDIQIVYVFPERLENNKNLSGWGASQFLWGGDEAQSGERCIWQAADAGSAPWCGKSFFSQSPLSLMISYVFIQPP